MLPKIGRQFIPAMLTLALIALSSCGGGGDSRGRFAYNLRLTGLPDSNTIAGHYEGWAVVGGVAFTTGPFIIDGVGPNAAVLSPDRTKIFGTAQSAEFGPARTELGEDFPYLTDASYLFITVEPEGDRDRTPSCVVILAGIISNDSAFLTPNRIPVPATVPCSLPDGSGGFFLGLQDFSQATGSFQMLSPTDDISNPTPNDHAGVWFVSSNPPPSPNYGPSLDLPLLGPNLRYESWATIDGIPRSMGTFRRATERDDDAMIALQRGSDGPGFDFPGGDFVVDYIPTIMNDPPSLDLTSSLNFMDGDYRAFVTVEPLRDNDPGPFQLELLSELIPPAAVNASFLSQGNVPMTSLFSSLPTIDATVTPTSIGVGNIGLRELIPGGSDRGGHFELWADIAGQATSAGRFLISGTNLVSLDSGMNLGDLMAATFDATTTGLVPFPDATLATSLFVTLEDEADDDGVPQRVLLAGALVANQTTMTVAGDGMGLGLANFANMSGLFHCATPTNNDGIAAPDDNLGIQFRYIAAFFDFLGVGLVLPVLPPEYIYEAWVQDRATGRSYSTGRFRNPGLPDQDHSTSLSQGSELPFTLPGKDFIFDVPTFMRPAAQPGLISEVFITVEYVPDGSLAPSFLRVLEATVPPNAVVNGVGGVDVPMTLAFPSTALFGGFMSFDVTN